MRSLFSLGVKRNRLWEQSHEQKGLTFSLLSTSIHLHLSRLAGRRHVAAVSSFHRFRCRKQGDKRVRACQEASPSLPQVSQRQSAPRQCNGFPGSELQNRPSSRSSLASEARGPVPHSLRPDPYQPLTPCVLPGGLKPQLGRRHGFKRGGRLCRTPIGRFKQGDALGAPWEL